MKKRFVLTSILVSGITASGYSGILEIKAFKYDDILIAVKDPQTMTIDELSELKKLYLQNPEFLEYIKAPEEVEQDLINEIYTNGTKDEVLSLENMLQHEEDNDIDFWILKPWIENTSTSDIEVTDNDRDRERV